MMGFVFLTASFGTIPLFQPLPRLLHVPPHGLHDALWRDFPQHIQRRRRVSIYGVAVRTAQYMPVTPLLQQ
ncbi:MAG: hypothetical protein ACO2PN_16000, partial [Pyrobaculum sp.]